MQSAAKLGEAGNIYNLNGRRNPEDTTDSEHSDSVAKLAAADAPGNKEREASNPSSSPEPDAGAKEAAGEPQVLSSGADDALAWLKIIQNATADLTSDLRRSKGEPFSGAREDEAEALKNPAPANSRRAGFYHESSRDEFDDERELAQKLSYRYSQPRSAPPQTLWAAIMPYVAATGLFAFLAGSAVAYFLLGGGASPDVKARTPAAVETRGETDQPGKKSGFLRAGAAADSVSPGSQTQEPQLKSVAQKDPQPQSWSETVETFKQFVGPERK